jgi:hypothetical protein
MHVQESRLRKSEQGDKWNFCLIAAIIVANRRDDALEIPVVCSENPIRVYRMMESAKLAR